MMKYNIEEGDERGFKAARAELLERFSRWAASSGGFDDDEVDEMASDVDLALDWKWNYGNGELTTWRTHHFEEFLIRWCPRKLSVSVEDSAPIPLSLVVFVTFLDSEGILGAGSSTLDSLSSFAVSRIDEFLTAMGDPSNFGMAKSLFAAAMSDGIDPTDQDELSGWVERYNELPEEERRSLIPDSALGSAISSNAVDLSPFLRLPSVVLPSDDEVAASKAAAPILKIFSDLAQFVGDGIKLTKTGNPTLTDARALVDLLGTGEVMDPKVGDRTFKTTSAGELPKLSQVLTWAKKAGVVRVVHGKLVATKRGLGLLKDPSNSFDKAVDALLAIGPLQSQRRNDGWFVWPEVIEMLDAMGVNVLIPPYSAQEPVELTDIVETATEMVLDEYEFRIPDDKVKVWIGRDIEDIMDAFALGGLITRSWASPVESSSERSLGEVELTPAGVVTVRRILQDNGFEVPVAGAHVYDSAEELLRAMNVEEFPVVYGEIRAWLQARDPDHAATEIADFLKVVDEPELINMGLMVMSEIGVDVAEPHVRKLVSNPSARGFALFWLVEKEKLEREALNDRSNTGSYVDILAQMLITDGPDGLREVLDMAGDCESQVESVSSLWNSPSLATEVVLAAIGEESTTKQVAKAARKALFKRRSARL